MISTNQVETDTYTRELNVEKVRDMSLALMAGQIESAEGRQDLLRLIPVEYGKVVVWLGGNYSEHASIVESMIIGLASATKLEQTMGLPQKDFGRSLRRLASQLSKAELFSYSPETLALAHRVTEMGDDEPSVEDWADRLAQDISKGTD